MFLALDKKELVNFALFGEGSPTHSPIAPTDPAFNKDIGLPPTWRRPAVAGRGRLAPRVSRWTSPVPAGWPSRERLVAAQQPLRPLGIAERKAAALQPLFGLARRNRAHVCGMAFRQPGDRRGDVAPGSAQGFVERAHDGILEQAHQALDAALRQHLTAPNRSATTRISSALTEESAGRDRLRDQLSLRPHRADIKNYHQSTFLSGLDL